MLGYSSTSRGPLSPLGTPRGGSGWGELAPSLLPFFWARFLERGREARRSGPQGTQEGTGSHRPSTGARAAARLGEGSRAHLSSQTLLVHTPPHLSPFGTHPSSGSQPKLLPPLPAARPESESRSHSFSLNFFFCSLLPEPLPSSAAPSCLFRIPEIQTPKLLVPLGSLLHPG